MQKKSNVSSALWFIPLLAVLLAAVFVFICWMGWTLWSKGSTSLASKPVTKRSASPASSKSEQVPVVPFTSVELEDEIPVPQEVADMQETSSESSSESEPEICPSTAVATKIKKPRRRVAYTPYEQGLRRCIARGVFPCAWEDKTAKVIQQFWLMNADGPVVRGIYDGDGTLISETISTINGTVTSYTERNITWYFEAGMLIKIRTSPYENCNFHDWFFINGDGKQDVCQCAYTVTDCCARSPYHEGIGRNYCELFPSDKDFCK